MKFLVLALCVYSASAAVPGFGDYQQPWGAVAQAAVQVGAQVGQAVVQPAVYAKSVLTGQREAEAPILKYDSEVNADSYKYKYETGNGISASSAGYLKNVDNSATLVSEGQYQYTAPDGTLVDLAYNADENGYQPKSNRLPVAPPVPEYILRALKYIAEHPQPVDDVKRF